MTSHAPAGYVCPFCLVAAGVENGHVLTRQADVVYRDMAVTAFIGVRAWPGCRGHVIVIPNAHHENLYDLPVSLGTEIHACAKAVAQALKEAYNCEGVSTRQHNEPAGNQDVWHYHLHVFPRWPGDGLYGSRPEPLSEAERAAFAARLREPVARFRAELGQTEGV